MRKEKRYFKWIIAHEMWEMCDLTDKEAGIWAKYYILKKRTPMQRAYKKFLKKHEEVFIFPDIIEAKIKGWDRF